MVTRPAVAPAAIPSSLATFLDLLACPACRARLTWVDGGVRCVACGRRYPLLPESQVPVLLIDDASAGGPGTGRAANADVFDRFAAIAQSLPESIRSFVTFLNLGYVADDSPQFATRGPERPLFNPFSTKLLFEVLGACDLDGRTTIELGSGRGGNVAMIHEYYRPRALVGLDLIAANAEFSQMEHAIGRGGFVVGAVEHLPFADGVAEVVLSLESSHYYAALEPFFDEVHRVLARGGDFLYADILPAATFDVARRYLEGLGLVCVRDQDISANVLLSCAAIAKLRDGGRYAKIYDTFLVVPGSAPFAALQAGQTRYKILAFRRP
jgi:SAM-dependent methyltransferase